MADQRRLREVLDHLLENALNFSPQGGTIDVIVRFMPLLANHLGEASGTDASRDQADVRAPVHVLEICVCDRGMGIPPQNLERIFERFQRVDNGLTREVNGLGLGLTICQHIVELHQAASGPRVARLAEVRFMSCSLRKKRRTRYLVVVQHYVKGEFLLCL